MHRSRLFWKYVVVLVFLVSGALVTSGAIEIYFSYQENKTALVGVQREKAAAAASRIDQFIREIENQIGWTTHASFTSQQSRRTGPAAVRLPPALPPGPKRHRDQLPGCVRPGATPGLPFGHGCGRKSGGLLQRTPLCRGQVREDVLQPGVFPEGIRALHHHRDGRAGARCGGYGRRRELEVHLGCGLADQDRESRARVRGGLWRQSHCAPGHQLGVAEDQPVFAPPGARRPGGSPATRGGPGRGHPRARSPRGQMYSRPTPPSPRSDGWSSSSNPWARPLRRCTLRSTGRSSCS